MRKLAAIVLLLTGLALPPAAAADTDVPGLYRRFNLGIPKSIDAPSAAVGIEINDTNGILGMTERLGVFEADIWFRRAGLVRIDDLGGGVTTPSSVGDLNDRGMYIGVEANGVGAFVQKGAHRKNLPALPDAKGFPPASPRGINDAGLIVGFSRNASARAQPVVWSHGRLRKLPLGGANGGLAEAVSENGIIVGYLETSFDFHAVMWVGDEIVEIEPGLEFNPTAVNDAGQVVGFGDGHAYLWHDGDLTDLGAGVAYDINEAGQIAGGLAEGQPVVWEPDLTVRMLPTFGATGMAHGINEAGNVVGSSDSSVPHEDHAVLWIRSP